MLIKDTRLRRGHRRRERLRRWDARYRRDLQKTRGKNPAVGLLRSRRTAGLVTVQRRGIAYVIGSIGLPAKQSFGEQYRPPGDAIGRDGLMADGADGMNRLQSGNLCGGVPT